MITTGAIIQNDKFPSAYAKKSVFLHVFSVIGKFGDVKIYKSLCIRALPPPYGGFAK
jgi:hypothetical protein